jgi:hypothetical protein
MKKIFYTLLISTLCSCANKSQEALLKEYKTINSEIGNIPVNPNWKKPDYDIFETDSLAIQKLGNDIESRLEGSKNFIGYYIFCPTSKNTYSKNLASWHFQGYYSDKPFRSGNTTYYIGELAGTTATRNPHISAESTNTPANNTLKTICAQQTFSKELFEVYYFFRTNKDIKDYNKVISFGR